MTKLHECETLASGGTFSVPKTSPDVFLGAIFMPDTPGLHAAVSAGSTPFASRSGMDGPAARTGEQHAT